MTLSSTTTRVSYNGDGSTASFSTSFSFLANADVVVVLRDADGDETTWVLGTQYTLSGAGTGSAGTVTVDTSPTDYTPASGETLTILRRPALTQNSALPLGGAFPSTTVEQALDRQTMISQRLDEELDRTPKFALTSTAADVTFPDPSADKVIGWNAGGTDLENKTANTSAYVTLPGSSTDNAIVRFNGTGGASVQNSGVTIDDSNLLTAPGGIAFDKGGDIASTSPLVIDTDGGMFDVTGSTGFSAMTVAAKRLFALQFDGALTMTHGAGTLDLPGGANITTAAGDVALCYSTAANTVRVLAYEPAAGYATARHAAGSITGPKLGGGAIPASTGFSATPYNAGTKSSGTYTPDEANGNLQYAVNGGAHTLAPPTNNCTIVIQYTNDGSAGAITTSGFTKVSGDSLTTTNGHDFLFFITKLNGFSHLHKQALQ